MAFYGRFSGENLPFFQFLLNSLDKTTIMRFLAIFGVHKVKNGHFLRFWSIFISWWGWKWPKIAKFKTFQKTSENPKTDLRYRNKELWAHIIPLNSKELPRSDPSDRRWNLFKNEPYIFFWRSGRIRAFFIRKLGFDLLIKPFLKNPWFY